MGKYIAGVKQTDNRETPTALFKALDNEFHFTLDVAATKANTKCKRFFSAGALERSWSGVCWMNPPYSKLGTWMRKAHQEWQRGGLTIVCLVPSATDTAWWHEVTPDAEVRFLKGRVRFNGTGNAPFPSALVIFRAPERD